MTDPCEQLHLYVDGELSPDEQVELELHLATCDACSQELPRLLALLSVLDTALDARAQKPAAPRLTLVPGAGEPEVIQARPTPRRRRPLWFASAALVAAAAAVLLTWRLARTPSDAPVVASLAPELRPTRSLEARLSYPGADRYRPLDNMRGAKSSEAISLDSMSRLDRAKDWHGVAVASLLAGERERAARFFEQAPPGPEVDSDRAALELMDGSDAALERALTDVDRALAASPNLPGALWNRALVLAGLNLPLAAAREFDRVVALNEPGWSDEARKYAAAQRQGVEQRRTRWKQVQNAGRRLLEDGTPVPKELTSVTGELTRVLYEAVRSAPSRERALALAPLAQQLDVAYGSDRLARYVQRIAASDFQVRMPFADAYRELILKGGMTDAAIDGLLAKLDKAGLDDIWMGATIWTGRVARHLDDYRRRAQASGDPWFAVIAEHETAKAAIARGEFVAAERQLHSALATAQRQRLAYRALLLRRELGALHTSLRQLSEAARDRQLEYSQAMGLGEWDREVNALSLLTAVNQDRYAQDLVQGYATELLERSKARPSATSDESQDIYDCAREQFAHESLAGIAVLGFDGDRARAELAAVSACNNHQAIPKHLAFPLRLRTALLQAEIFGLSHRDDDARVAHDSVASLRGDPELTSRELAFLSYIDGRLLIDQDHDAGGRVLREAIAQAGDQTIDLNVKARAYSFALLAVDAGQSSRFAEVIGLLAETLGVAKSDRCTVAIAIHDDRSVMAFSDSRGEISGQYMASRKSFNLDASVLMPATAIERLRACDHIAVLSRAPVLGTGRLLPPDLAWSYVIEGHSRVSAAHRRVVVANPETPAELRLPALGLYFDNPVDGDMLLLRGRDATPTRVLQEIRDASVIEFHTHGFIANDVSEASYLVLSPEPDRSYALTARDVTTIKLEAAPLVILAACHAATSSRSLEGGMGLAEAFLRSGARAVIASPDAIPDLAGAAFFAAIRERVQQGTNPAVAVREERMRRLASSPEETWVSGVVVFE
jgi:hypothetical protein